MDWRPGYRELPPPAALRTSVSCLWVAVVPPGEYRNTTVLPDACVDLIWERGKGAYVAGPDTGPSPAVSPPGTIMAGVRFAPGAGGPALRMPMSELLDQRVDVGDLGCGPAAALRRVLSGALEPETALRVLTGVAGALTDEGPADQLAAQAARLLGAAPLPDRGPVQAETVADDLGVSERQLRRRCQASVGYGPATLRRVLRFRRFVSWADAGRGGDLASVAFELGYADQAHLTRECARLAGLTPAALAAARRPALPGLVAPRRPHHVGLAGRGLRAAHHAGPFPARAGIVHHAGLVRRGLRPVHHIGLFPYRAGTVHDIGFRPVRLRPAHHAGPPPLHRVAHFHSSSSLCPYAGHLPGPGELYRGTI